jgi:hypothetical protein
MKSYYGAFRAYLRFTHSGRQPAVFQNERNRLTEAFFCLVLRMALTVCPGHLRAIGDEPLAVALYYCRKFIVHGGQTTPFLALPAHSSA